MIKKTILKSILIAVTFLGLANASDKGSNEIMNPTKEKNKLTGTLDRVNSINENASITFYGGIDFLSGDEKPKTVFVSIEVTNYTLTGNNCSKKTLSADSSLNIKAEFSDNFHSDAIFDAFQTYAWAKEGSEYFPLDKETKFKITLTNLETNDNCQLKFESSKLKIEQDEFIFE